MRKLGHIGPNKFGKDCLIQNHQPHSKLWRLCSSTLSFFKTSVRSTSEFLVPKVRNGHFRSGVQAEQLEPRLVLSGIFNPLQDIDNEPDSSPAFALVSTDSEQVRKLERMAIAVSSGQNSSGTSERDRFFSEMIKKKHCSMSQNRTPLTNSSQTSSPKRSAETTPILMWKHATILFAVNLWPLRIITKNSWWVIIPSDRQQTSRPS